MKEKIDAKAIMDWIDNGMKSPSILAFAEGANRDCAWLVEYAIKRKIGELPEPPLAAEFEHDMR